MLQMRSNKSLESHTAIVCTDFHDTAQKKEKKKEEGILRKLQSLEYQ